MTYSFRIDEKKLPVFSPDYENQVFMIWYQKGKLSPNNLLAAVPPNEDGDKPTRMTLTHWINEKFIHMANDMDAEVLNRVEDQLVQDKVEMINRHITIAREMQETGLEYLRSLDGDDLTPQVAFRLLVEGIRIETESVGIPSALKKLATMTDEQLTDKVKELIERSPVDILPLEDTVIDPAD